MYKAFTKEEMKKYRDWRQSQLTEQEHIILSALEEFRVDPEILDEYFDFVSKFYQYSPRNKILIYKQNPNAMFCSSYKGFEKMGYHVRKGEKGLNIMVPVRVRMIEIEDNGRKTKVQYSKASDRQQRLADEGKLNSFEYDTYRIGKVFDIAQTDCPSDDYPKYLDIGHESIECAEAGELIKDFARDELDVRVVKDDFSSVALRGEYDLFTNTIRTNEVYEDSTQLSILTHELGHAMLHNSIFDVSTMVCEREFEADCVSILLLKRFGVEVPLSRMTHALDQIKLMYESGGRFDNMLLSCMAKATRAVSRVTNYLDIRMMEKEDRALEQEAEMSSFER